MKSKLLNFVLIFGLVLSLFTGCNGDVDEQLFNGTGTEPIVKVTYTPESKSRLASEPEPVTVTIKVPSRVVLESFLADNGIVAGNVTGLEFYGIREIQGNDNNGKTFASCVSLKTVFMDESLTDIGEYAFYQTEEIPIKTLEMKAVERIGKYAFNGCKKLSEVIFPETIERIDEKAFHGCEGMETIVFTGKTAPEIAKDAFQNTEKLRSIIVPAGSKESYQKALPDTLKTKVSDEDKKLYTITFNPNGGSGTMGTQTFTQGETKALSENTFTAPAGKIFAGWSTTSDGDVTYTNKQEISPTSDMTLYAKWDFATYLCFTAVAGNSTVEMSVNGTLTTTPALKYSTDGGSTWTTFDIGTTKVTLENIGDKVYLCGNNASFSESDSKYLKFVLGGEVAASGNIMSLLDSSCQKTDLTGMNYVFSHLFSGCASLTTAPELPATILASHCYEYMFSGCSNLETAPELPATTLENCDNCYSSMFLSCTKLETTPDLLATTLAKYCYEYMFSGCTNLTTVPALPATSLADNCYASMFSGCTLLTSAPELPATTLKEYCYNNMFGGCTSLVTVPDLKATILAARCCYNMFSGCTSLVTAPKLPATTLETACYAKMFYGCSSLKNIEVSFTSWNGDNVTLDWVDGVAATGEFTCPAGLDTATRDASHIPANWTLNIPVGDKFFFTAKASGSKIYLGTGGGSPTEIAFEYSTDNCATWNNYTLWTEVTLNTGDKVFFRAKEASSTGIFSSSDTAYYKFSVLEGKFDVSGNIMYLADKEGKTDAIGDYAFYRLFYECTGLESAENLLLPDVISKSCYSGMFNGCTGLTAAPELPAVTLKERCYDYMFYGCSALAIAPELPATTLAKFCYNCMFRDCGLTAAPALPATSVENCDFCYQYMFNGCTGLTAAPELPATTLAVGCYFNMFGGCSGLNSVTVGFTDWGPYDSSYDCWPADYWLNGVSSTGTFKCPSGLNTDTRDESHVPSGWEVSHP